MMRAVQAVYAGQVFGHLRNEVRAVHKREIRTALDVFDDQIGRGENLPGCVYKAGLLNDQAQAVSQLQQPEFILRRMGIVLECTGARAAKDPAGDLALGVLDFKGRHLRRYSALQGPGSEQLALREEF